MVPFKLYDCNASSLSLSYELDLEDSVRLEKWTHRRKVKKKHLRDLARMSQMYWFAAVVYFTKIPPKTFELNSLAITWYVI